jgi:hypothetical protein
VRALRVVGVAPLHLFARLLKDNPKNNKHPSLSPSVAARQTYAQTQAAGGAQGGGGGAALRHRSAHHARHVHGAGH